MVASCCVGSGQLCSIDSSLVMILHTVRLYREMKDKLENKPSNKNEDKNELDCRKYDERQLREEVVLPILLCL